MRTFTILSGFLKWSALCTLGNCNCVRGLCVCVCVCVCVWEREREREKKNWTLILRDEHTLRVFDNRVLRKIFCRRRDGWHRTREQSIMKYPMFCTSHQILFEWSNEEEQNGRTCSTHHRKEEVHTGFVYGYQRQMDHFGRYRRIGENDIKTDLQQVRWGHGLDWYGSR
jgi:hypothetical protein